MLLAPLLYFKLTAEQRAALAPAEAALSAAARAGAPGLLLAQLVDGYALVGFIEHERAAQIVAGLGGDVTQRIARVEEREGRLVVRDNTAEEEGDALTLVSSVKTKPVTAPLAATQEELGSGEVARLNQPRAKSRQRGQSPVRGKVK